MSSERMQKGIWNKTLKSYKYFKIKFPAWSSLKEECRSWQSTYLKCSSEGTLGILKANVNLPRANYIIKKKNEFPFWLRSTRTFFSHASWWFYALWEVLKWRWASLFASTKDLGFTRVKQQSVPNDGFQRCEDVAVQKKMVIPGMVTGIPGMPWFELCVQYDREIKQIQSLHY